jgi:uncharacterized FlaG/YvyC family protein
MDALSSNYQITRASVDFRRPNSDEAQKQRTNEPRAETADQLTNAASASLEKLNAKLATNALALRFFVDETTGKTVFRLIEASSGKTMRQIPNEQALATIRALDQARGWLLNAKL